MLDPVLGDIKFRRDLVHVEDNLRALPFGIRRREDEEVREIVYVDDGVAPSSHQDRQPKESPHEEYEVFKHVAPQRPSHLAKRYRVNVHSTQRVILRLGMRGSQRKYVYAISGRD